MNQNKLIQSVIQKNQKAFEQIYHEYYRLIYYVVFKMIGNKDDSNELVQDVFLSVYQNINEFKGGNFKYWILQIAKNHANNYLSRVVKKQKKVIHNEGLVNKIPDHHSIGSVDDLLGQHFSDEAKQIIILKTIFDYSFQDIAEEMNLSKNHVYRSFKASLPTLKLILEV